MRCPKWHRTMGSTHTQAILARGHVGPFTVGPCVSVFPSFTEGQCDERGPRARGRGAAAGRPRRAPRGTRRRARECATMWGPFAAFYNDVKAFCCVVQRCGVVLGRSATMWCRFAPSCNDVVLIFQRRSSFSRVGPHSLENERAALIWCRFAAFCNDVVSFCGVLQRCGVLLRRSALIWGHL